MLPVMDGFAACRQLKENDETRLIPIVIMTALDSMEDRIRGIEAGADDFLTKPVNPRELTARIQTALRLKHTVDRKLTEVARVRDHFAEFVPESVKHLVAANLDAPEPAKCERSESFSMEPQPLQHKLAAILYADVAGYSRLTGDDEDGTHRTLIAYLDAFAAAIRSHHGTVKHYAGDAVLADFSTVSDALSCAVAIQRELKARNNALPESKRVQFRIGVNLGEVYGNAVNVAARLETLAEPGGICVSSTVVDAGGAKLPLTYEYLGEHTVKNIE